MAILKNTASLAIVAALVLLLAGELAHAGRAPMSTGKVERGLRAGQQHIERLLNEAPVCAGSGSVATGDICTGGADCATAGDGCLIGLGDARCYAQCGTSSNFINKR